MLLRETWTGRPQLECGAVYETVIYSHVGSNPTSSSKFYIMCVVSMIGEHYQDKWQQPHYYPYVYSPETVSKLEFEALKREVEEMKKLLERALKYDKDNHEPNCEHEDKVAFIKKMAELVGVDLSEIFAK